MFALHYGVVVSFFISATACAVSLMYDVSENEKASYFTSIS